MKGTEMSGKGGSGGWLGGRQVDTKGAKDRQQQKRGKKNERKPLSRYIKT